MSSSQNNRLNTNPADTRIVATNMKVTGPAAQEMLRRSGIMAQTTFDELNVMDNACGGGILTSELLEMVKARPNQVKIGRIVASDNDQAMLDYIHRYRCEPEWKSVEVKRIDQQAVPLPDATFSDVFNNFGVFFCPDDAAALAETLRLLRPGGVAGFTSWKTIAWWSSVAMPAISSLIPEAPRLPEPSVVFPVGGWSDPAEFTSKLEKAGFRHVNVSEYSFTPNVEAEEFAEAAGFLVQIIAKKFWSEKDNERFKGQIVPAMRKYLLEHYPNGRWNGQVTAYITIGNKA